MDKRIDVLTDKIKAIQQKIDKKKSLIEDLRTVVNDYDATQHRLNRLKVRLSETKFYNSPNLESIRTSVIRGWGNAYISDCNGKTAIWVLDAWNRMAHSCDLTVDDKIHAINMMNGDIWDEYKTMRALNTFKKNNGLEFDSTYIL